jgi:hypothetical protein
MSFPQRELGGKFLEATAKLADDLRLCGVGDEEAMTGSGDSHMDEVSHLLLQPAVHHVRLTRPRPSRVSICQGRLQFPVAVARCGRTVAFVKVGDTLVNEELIR